MRAGAWGAEAMSNAPSLAVMQQLGADVHAAYEDAKFLDNQPEQNHPVVAQLKDRLKKIDHEMRDLVQQMGA